MFVLQSVHKFTEWRPQGIEFRVAELVVANLVLDEILVCYLARSLRPTVL